MDKMTEYQQVAALVCGDIDATVLAAKANPDMAIELIELLQENKNKLISDAEHRNMRYSAKATILAMMRM